MERILTSGTQIAHSEAISNGSEDNTQSNQGNESKKAKASAFGETEPTLQDPKCAATDNARNSTKNENEAKEDGFIQNESPAKCMGTHTEGVVLKA